MSINKLITFLVVLLVLSSCSKRSEDTNILINIENEFTVSMIETLSPSTNPLNFNLNTINKLECSNYEIIHSKSTSDGRVILSIDYISEPEDCIADSAHISSEIPVGRLSNGSYLFQLNLEKGSILNEGTLTIDNKAYTVELDSYHGIDFPVKKLNKIPDAYVWGQINVAPEAPNNIIEELLEELSDITDESSLAPGNYGHFKIDDDHDFSFDANQALNFSPSETSSFIFSLSNTTETDIKSVLDTYRNAYEGKIDIQLITSEGEIL